MGWFDRKTSIEKHRKRTLSAAELDLSIALTQVRDIGWELRHLYIYRKVSLEDIYAKHRAKLEYVKKIYETYSLPTTYSTKYEKTLTDDILSICELILMAFKSCDPDLI